MWQNLFSSTNADSSTNKKVIGLSAKLIYKNMLSLV